MVGEAAQRFESVLVFRAVCTQLQAITLGNHQGNFQHIDRIKSQAIAIQRGIRINLRRRGIEVKGLDHQFSNFALQIRGTGNRRFLGVLHGVYGSNHSHGGQKIGKIAGSVDSGNRGRIL